MSSRSLVFVKRGAGLFVLAAGLAACGGSHLTSPAPLAAEEAALTVRVRLPAAFAGSSLAAWVAASGSRAPAAQAASVQLASSACAVTGGERLCTLRFPAPLGLVDVALRVAGEGGESLSGTAPRQLVAPADSTLSVAFDGTPARWAFSPEMLVGPADGAAHQLLFAVLARDAQGFTLLRGAPQPPAAVSIAGDALHQLSVTVQGSGTFALQYGGQPVGNVTLSASAPGAAPAAAAFAALAANPASLEIAVGQPAPLQASLAHYAGAFEASSGERNCTVSPAAATPASAGATVEFAVRLLSGQGCEIRLRAAQYDVPIVIPAKNAVAAPGIGIGPSKIKHVVLLFQENRSFDNIFGGLDQNGKPFPGADTVSHPDRGEPTPHNHLGQPVAMSTGLLEEHFDPDHDHPNSVQDVDGGKMDGFDQEGVTRLLGAPGPAPTNYVYRTIEESEVAPYWEIGEQYAISDRMFEPFSSASYGPHLYLVAGQSAGTIDNPTQGWGCDAAPSSLVDVMDPATGGEDAGVFPCFNAPTLGDVMDQRGVSWRYYATNNLDFGYYWSAYNSFQDIRYGPDWTAKVITPPSQLLTDVASGTLASMTWVTPTNATSDHPQSQANMGPAWIASVVNAIGTSQFWDSTAIFVTWDDWGGWYDHVPPPVTTPYFSMGIRVPLIIVSPYARHGYVSHVRHTTGSILHFAEEVLDLPSLGEEDARRDDLMDAFNFAQKPAPFKTFMPAYTKQQIFRAATRSTRPPDQQRVGD